MTKRDRRKITVPKPLTAWFSEKLTSLRAASAGTPERDLADEIASTAVTNKRGQLTFSVTVDGMATLNRFIQATDRRVDGLVAARKRGSKSLQKGMELLKRSI